MNLRVSPSALSTYLSCPRAWWLKYRARVSQDRPSYVTAGSDLDELVQGYLRDPIACSCEGAWGNSCIKCGTLHPELAALTSVLPAPGSVEVQPELVVPAARDITYYGKLDWLRREGNTVYIGDLKRVYHKQAAHTHESLAADVQAQFYAWLIQRLYAPERIVWQWTYCDRRPKAWIVEAEANMSRVDAWFSDVVLPAVEGMLQIRGPALQVVHDPDSCQSGARCFVAAHCPIFQGPLKGDHQVLDLNRFSTRPAVNPPAPDTLTVATVEGPGAALLQVDTTATAPSPSVQATDTADTLPAPAPDEPVLSKASLTELVRELYARLCA